MKCTKLPISKPNAIADRMEAYGCAWMKFVKVSHTAVTPVPIAGPVVLSLDGVKNNDLSLCLRPKRRVGLPLPLLQLSIALAAPL